MPTKTIVSILVAVAVIGGAFYYLNLGKEPALPQAATTNQQATSTGDLGTFSYECDEHVAMTLSIAGDTNSIVIAPNSASQTWPPQTTLVRKPASSGVRYEGGTIVLVAHGETVTLNPGTDGAINCSPVANPDMAPFNFGD